MRLFSVRWAMWLRVPAAGAVAGVLALATGVSFGSLSGNAPGFTTNAPDPVSAQVVRNGANNGSGGSTNDAEFLVCFDKQLQTISSSSSFVSQLTLNGYGTGEGGFGGGFTPSQYLDLGGGQNAPAPTIKTDSPGGYTYTATAANNPSNPNCANVTITPTSSQPCSCSPPGVDLNSFTMLSVGEGAGAGLSGLPTTPASVALQPVGTPEVAPMSGASTGPKLLSISKSASSPTTLTYVFNYNLDPNNVNPGVAPPAAGSPAGFAYYDSGGAEHFGSTATVSGNTVTVQFGANVVNDVYYVVYPKAVYTQTTEVPNPVTTKGGTVSSVPTIQSVAPVAGVPGAYDVTYDQPVTVGAPNQFAAVLEDNSVVDAPAGSTSRPSSNSNVVRVSFGNATTNFSDFASKVVKVIDKGAAVFQQAAPNNPSAPGEGDASTPPNMQAGFSNGPNLIGISIDKAHSTVTYFFDKQYGSLALNGGVSDDGKTPVLHNFGLLYKDGTNSLDAGSLGSGATYTGPNQVTVQYNPSQLGTASNPVVAGIIGTGTTHASDCTNTPPTPCEGDGAVSDYQGSENLSPEVSGIGVGSTTTTTTLSRTTTTTRTSTGTTTTTTHRVVHHKKHKKHKCRKGTVRRHGKCVKKHKRRRHRRH